MKHTLPFCSIWGGRSLRRVLHFSRLPCMSPWSSCQGAPLGDACHIFASCTGLYMSRRFLCTAIPGSSIYLVRLHCTTRLHLQHCLRGWRWPHPFHVELAIVMSDRATLDWAWDLRMLLDIVYPDASLVVSANGMHEEEVIAWWKLGRFELPTPCAEKLVAAVVISTVVMEDVYSLHVNACSFLNRSADRSQDCPSSRNISWQCSDLMCVKAPSFPGPRRQSVLHPVYVCIR